jgi:hypothetical protein
VWVKDGKTWAARHDLKQGLSGGDRLHDEKGHAPGVGLGLPTHCGSLPGTWIMLRNYRDKGITYSVLFNYRPVGANDHYTRKGAEINNRLWDVIDAAW